MNFCRIYALPVCKIKIIIYWATKFVKNFNDFFSQVPNTNERLIKERERKFLNRRLIWRFGGFAWLMGAWEWIPQHLCDFHNFSIKMKQVVAYLDFNFRFNIC